MDTKGGVLERMTTTGTATIFMATCPSVPDVWETFWSLYWFVRIGLLPYPLF